MVLTEIRHLSLVRFRLILQLDVVRRRPAGEQVFAYLPTIKSMKVLQAALSLDHDLFSFLKCLLTYCV